MYWKQTWINCDMIVPVFVLLFSFFPAFSGQTDIIYRTFLYVCVLGRKLEPSVSLNLWNTLFKSNDTKFSFIFVNIQMNLFDYLYVVMPPLARENLAISSKQNTTKKLVIVFLKMPLTNPNVIKSLYVRAHTFIVM